MKTRRYQVPFWKIEVRSQRTEDRINKAFRNFIFSVLCLLFSVLYLLTGCSSDWEKKFIRKRVKPPRPAQFEIAKPVRPYPELYKEHFNYWKNWHRQIIADLGRNHKRERHDLRETRRHLESLQKYLKDDQAKKAAEFLAELDRITIPLKRSRMSENDYGILERRLDALEMRVNHTLHPKKVKEFFLPTPVPLNMEEYQGAEPILPLGVEIKPEVPVADTDKDGDSGTLTYEKYRNLPVS